MAEKTHYIIRGGVEGRERLRVLARVMQPATLSLLHRAGIRPGMACLDVGCGGGDVWFENVRMNVVRPAGTDGEVELITPLTMENIAEAVLAEGLASRAEIDGLVADLYAFARAPGTVGSGARVVEAWGRRPAA